MKSHLITSFRFNDWANQQMLEKINTLPDRTEGIRYLSHLINSQNKWLARITLYPAAPDMDWWEPVYPEDELKAQLEKSTSAWISFLNENEEQALQEEVKFSGYDGKHWAAPLMDIALQLIYHSFHHRAQIQMIIRAQGIEPDFIDYISTKYRRLPDPSA